MSLIQYDFAALDTLTGDLNRNFARLEQLSGQLRTQVNALATHWQSAQGAQAYQDAQHHWDRVFDESRTRLNNLSSAVTKASSTMGNTDMRVGRTFAV
ncbi:WXG100 family type VII secretion target [Gordonia sp. X0973]|uniref:WXG100 family type VII secretion target n=1 Tax=Gordonia sp. X0973 TaxID=2742602 RepID=UPI000F547220|nr:WXG100 family type VII secretion target [Gordonia sp. X0973]QKT08136.1 WXG100 family type VII secretion target [Gordonia sp. X0973]